MVTSSDESYKSTKLIKQGKAKICTDFEPLADWILATYGYKPINIIYEKINNGRIIPRLEIVFETAVNFYYIKTPFDYDETITKAIAEKFEEIVSGIGLNKKQTIFNLFFRRKSKYDVRQMFVVFSEFKQIAKEEANEKISNVEIRLLMEDLNNNQLWKIVQSFSSVVFFFYEQSQIQQNIDNGFRDLAAAKYFELLKKYDEFDYFKEDEFSVELDSKENLDKNYDGNFYYYFK